MAGLPNNLLGPNTAYGDNLVTREKMGFVYQGAWTSGGINEVRVVPQIQTVQVLADHSLTLNGVPHWSGRVNTYDTTLIGGNRYQPQELVWAIERNNQQFQSGLHYDGQLAGYSASGAIAPTYLCNVGGTVQVAVSGGPPTGSGTQLNVVTNICCSGLKTSGTLSLTSGTYLTALEVQFTPILFPSGSILGVPFCAPCPQSGCCPPISSGSAQPCLPVYCGCTTCSGGLEMQASFIANGFADNDCQGCIPLNGQQVFLTFEPGTCCLTSPDFTICAQNVFWQLCANNDGSATLSVQPGNLLTYTAPGPWNCVSPITLNYAAGTICQPNSPPSITVNPFPNVNNICFPCSGSITSGPPASGITSGGTSGLPPPGTVTTICCSGIPFPTVLFAHIFPSTACLIPGPVAVFFTGNFLPPTPLQMQFGVCPVSGIFLSANEVKIGGDALGGLSLNPVPLFWQGPNALGGGSWAGTTCTREVIEFPFPAFTKISILLQCLVLAGSPTWTMSFILTPGTVTLDCAAFGSVGCLPDPNSSLCSPFELIFANHLLVDNSFVPPKPICPGVFVTTVITF